MLLSFSPDLSIRDSFGLQAIHYAVFTPVLSMEFHHSRIAKSILFFVPTWTSRPLTGMSSSSVSFTHRQCVRCIKRRWRRWFRSIPSRKTRILSSARAGGSNTRIFLPSFYLSPSPIFFVLAGRRSPFRFSILFVYVAITLFEVEWGCKR